jgi:putative membrane protein
MTTPYSLLTRAIFTSLLAVGTPAVYAHAALTADDRTFLADATASNQKEIDVSNLAVRQASSAKVKTFARGMVRDHTKMAADLAKLNDGSVSAAPPTDAPDADLAGKSGHDFDKAYMDKMVADHDATVAKFTATAHGKGFSAPVRNAAKKALPTIRHHDAMAKTLASSISH